MKYTPVSISLLSVALASLLFAGGCHSNQPAQQQTAQPQQQQGYNNQQPAQNSQSPQGQADNSRSQPASQTPPPEQAQQPAQESQPAPRNYSEATPAPAPRPVSYTIPAGTRISVALDQAISSGTAKDGDPFNATVRSPIVVNGRTVVRSGAAASGTIAGSNSRGRFKGAAVLALRLNSIRANGQELPITTSEYSRQEKGKGKRSAAFIGGGGGLGALIGGLAGGGKGALIGGLAGAGAGTAGTALTGNKQIVLPAETVITFRLANSVTLR